VPALLASQHHLLTVTRGSIGEEEWRLQPSLRPASGLAAVEGIAQPGEEALLTRRELARRSLLAAQLR
jgi:hypothetical protein